MGYETDIYMNDNMNDNMNVHIITNDGSKVNRVFLGIFEFQRSRQKIVYLSSGILLHSI